MNIQSEYDRWLANVTEDEDLLKELREMDSSAIEDAFYRDLAFGTGGLRGIIGAGTNRMNIYTVRKASQGLSNYLKPGASVVIGYDSRIKSNVFAKNTEFKSGSGRLFCLSQRFHLLCGNCIAMPVS